MKRNTLALAAGVALALGSSVMITADASFVKTSATLMMQGQATSRWQPDRFGPIVSSDTLWSIAMYYGDKSDLSVYEMMDLFIEQNPEVFIDGRADRMMDGFYLKVPKEAQQALGDKQAMAAQSSPVTTEVAESSTSTSTQPETSTASTPSTTTDVETTATESATPVISAEETTTAAAPAEAENDSGSVSFSVEELTRLRDQLAESTALIERLNTENSTLQSRLDEVTRELDVLQKKVNAEQVAEDNLQEQIAAEIAATNATSEQADDAPASASVATVEQSEPTAQAETTPDVSDSEALAKQQAQAATQQPAATQSEATQPAAEQPAKPVVKRKKQSDVDAFLEWLMQPFQLTLAILIPLLLATIIWYVLYVRRLNREHLGPYNGALQAAEKDKNEEANQEPQTLSAYEEAEQAAAAEEAADMPEFERIDDAVDIDEQTKDTAAINEAEQLDNELESLGQDEQANEAASQEHTEEADLDTLLSQSFEEEATEVQVEETIAPEPEAESQPEPQPELDNSLEFSVDPEPAATDISEEPAEKPAQKQTESTADDEDMGLDFVIDQPTSSATDDTVELEQFEDINLDDLDLEGLTTDSASDDDKNNAQDTDEGYLEIDDLLADADNEDPDFDSPRFEREAGQLDDEETPSGMLDLARAYMELDEYELARAELEKVNQTDDEDAKREAAMLLQKLDEQGH